MSITTKEFEDFVQEMARIPVENEAYSVLGLCGESGEVAEWYKKVTHRGDTSHTEKDLFKELGDVLHYVTRLALARRWTLRHLMQGNVDKLRARRAKEH